MNVRKKITMNSPARRKREGLTLKAKRLGPTPPINSPIDQILHLQRTIGNQAVQRLLNSNIIQAKDEGKECKGSSIRIEVRKNKDLEAQINFSNH